MRRPSWATWPVLVLIAVAVLVGAGVVIVVAGRGGGQPKPRTAVASDVTATIPTSDGVKLSAEVITPKGRGPFPLVVMPGSFGAAATEYHLPGSAFAVAGFQVVAYAQRGATGSGGQNDFAGDATQRDARTVIDWALAHTHADRNHIGLLGVSYGAGISLLTAAHDPRVKAVVAMSGWSDLLDALAPHDTPNVQSLHTLLDGRLTSASLGAAPRAIGATLSGPGSGTESVLAAQSPSRSPDAVVRQLNANKPAIMLANGYQDSILDPSSLVPFFGELTTPKRLQLAPGEHGGPEHVGLLGRPDKTFADALQWLEHYLRGAANGIDRADPIQLADGATGAWHGYRSWPTSSTAVRLPTPNKADDAVPSAAQPWTRRVKTGTDSGAGSGPPFVVAPNPYHAPRVPISSVRTAAAYTWTGPTLKSPTTISGSPTLHVTVSSPSPKTTFFTYLYDVNSAGTAALMTYAPETTAPGATTVTLRPMSWTLAAGHHWQLVVDTVDQHYVSATPSGSTLTLSSTAAAPATLTIPRG